MTEEQDLHWMQQALQQAHTAADQGEVPVGAVVVREGQLVARGHNQPRSTCDPTAHAEVVALRQAGLVLHNYRLPGCTLYVTLEPCAMCVGALVHGRIERLVYGASDPKTGCVHSVAQGLSAPHHNHRVAVHAGVGAAEAAALLQHFFQQRR